MTRQCGEVNWRAAGLALADRDPILARMKICRSLLVIWALFLVAACASSPENEPNALVTPHPGVGMRHAMNYMVLNQTGPQDGHDQYHFSALDAGRISVSFISQVQSRVSLQAVCDAPAFTRPAQRIVANPPWIPAGQSVNLVLGPQARNQSLLELSTEVTQCDLTVTPGGSAPYRIRMQREDLARPEIAQLDTRHEGCATEVALADPLARAFATGGGLSMTCAVGLGPTRILPEGLDALSAKVEALTGRAISREQLLRGDPSAPLDWSNAPRLDLIYVNYLNLNADFSGYMVARMLAWHAARGTTVRILVSDVMLTDTDRNLFEGLAAQYPSIQIQPYRFPATAAVGGEGQLARIHRVTHVKLFGTVSSQPGRSRVMIGGRNVHEGYFFERPRDLSDFPFLHQYDPEQTRLTGGFTAYDDFEIELRGDAATRSVMQHMGALWHRDHDTQSPVPPRTTGRIAAAGDGTVRHFISVPFADAMAQVDYYAGLFDAAQHSIRIAIPYLNMPQELDAAMRRARDRGVQVDVVTTVRVREAADFMVTGLNRQFANDFGAWVTFTDYDPITRLLHSKMIVIDDRLTVIASTNLNMRSFVHDLENGLVIMDRGVARRVSAVIQSYIGAGTRVLPGQEVPRLVQFLRRVGVITRGF